MKSMTSTQRVATAGTYRKLAKLIGGPGMKVLDYGAGLCHGTAILGANAQSFEPNPQPGIEPDYTDAQDIPRFRYDAVVCNCVLNVVDNHETRIKILENLWDLIHSDGSIYIMVRSHSDVNSIKRATPDGDGVRTSTGSFQRGFDHKELRDLIELALPHENLRMEKVEGISSIGIRLTMRNREVF